MMMQLQSNFDPRFGTVVGTLFTVVINLHLHDILKTIVLAAIGAVVSFFVSWFLKGQITPRRPKKGPS